MFINFLWWNSYEVPFDEKHHLFYNFCDIYVFDNSDILYFTSQMILNLQIFYLETYESLLIN